LSELYSEHWPTLKEVRELAERFRRYRPTTIREILSCWADRRPIEVPLSMIENLFVGTRSLRETMDLVLSHLRDRDWRGFIARIVGEYGSGKTQLGRLLLRAIREEGEAEPRFVTLDPLTDVRDLLVEKLDAEGPVVLIIDEVDQLLRDLERGRREKLEDLADVVRWVTEGHGSPPRGSVILLLSKRAQEALMSDRALANRLLERSRVFKLSMSDEERERAGIEAAKKILALWMAYSPEYASLIERIFPALYPLMEKVARDLALTREIGGIVKNLVDLSEEVLRSVRREATLLSRVEEGSVVEGIIREFLTREMRSFPFKVRLGDEVKDYIAVFSPERLSAQGAVSDGQFLVWTYDANAGRKGDVLVSRVAVEIKFGDYWVRERDQIIRLLEKPLLVISVTDADPEEMAEVEAEMRRGGRPFALLTADPDLFRVAYLLEGERALNFLRERGNFERDMPEVLSQLMVPTAVRQVTSEGLSEDKLLRQAASSILSSLIRELKRAKTSKRTTTLINAIVASVDSVYAGAGTRPPAVGSGTINMIIRVLIREGLGRLSESGKSLMLNREARLILEEIERDDKRRRDVELVIYDILSRSKEVPTI